MPVLTRLYALEDFGVVALYLSCAAVLTDSGGLQKEAYFYRAPCTTQRDKTEWVETVEAGWNQLVGANENNIIQAVRNAKAPATMQTALYGDGDAAEIIVRRISRMVD